MRFSQKILRWVPVLILATYTCGTVLARDKTDIIVLKNGNQITGEIQELSRGLLTLKTNSMETVKIKWQDIDKITSEHSFAVEVSNGWIFISSLSPAEEPRALNAVGPVLALNLRKEYKMAYQLLCG